MSKKPKGKHGGPRANSGRKPVYGPVATYSVKISLAQAALLKKWGGGDLSAGLRWLIDTAAPMVQCVPPKQP